jgi:hypothetical protein
MKKYCFDMSGLSTPLELMPPDIHVTMWTKVEAILASGEIAITKEIYDEMAHLPGSIGDCIKKCEALLVLEVEQDNWDWPTYIERAARMQVDYEGVISEYNGDRKNTVCLNDISIIALTKTLGLPVVSMEAALRQVSETKKRIPEICGLEGVAHYDFSEFLRNAGIRP